MAFAKTSPTQTHALVKASSNMHSRTHEPHTRALSPSRSLALSLAQSRTSHAFLDQLMVCIHGFSEGPTDAHTRGRKCIGNQTCAIIRSLTHSNPHQPHTRALDQVLLFLYAFCADYSAELEGDANHVVADQIGITKTYATFQVSAHTPHPHTHTDKRTHAPTHTHTHTHTHIHTLDDGDDSDCLTPHTKSHALCTASPSHVHRTHKQTVCCDMPIIFLGCALSSTLTSTPRALCQSLTRMCTL
jgi:hypothetical protein